MLDPMRKFHQRLIYGVLEFSGRSRLAAEVMAAAALLLIVLGMGAIMVVLLGGCAGPPRPWERGAWLRAQTNVWPELMMVSMTNEAGTVVSVPMTNYRESYIFTPGTNVETIQRTVRAVDGVLGGWGEVLALLLGGGAAGWAAMRTKLARGGLVAVTNQLEVARNLLKPDAELEEALVEHMVAEQEEWGVREEVRRALRESSRLKAARAAEEVRARRAELLKLKSYRVGKGAGLE